MIITNFSAENAGELKKEASKLEDDYKTSHNTCKNCGSNDFIIVTPNKRKRVETLAGTDAVKPVMVGLDE